MHRAVQRYFQCAPRHGRLHSTRSISCGGQRAEHRAGLPAHRLHGHGRGRRGHYHRPPASCSAAGCARSGSLPGRPSRRSSRSRVRAACSSAGHCKRLAYIGFPMGFEYSVSAIGAVIMQDAINLLGNAAVAAQTAGEKIARCSPCPWRAWAWPWPPM